MTDAAPALLRWATTILSGAGSSSGTARLDAETLLAHVLGMERLAMLAAAPPVEGPQSLAFRLLVERRRRGEPVAYLVGHREFWSLRLMVTPDVLVPRPDSETLIEAALDWFAARAPSTILDLGTGSGALLLAALSEWPGAWGLGIDRSPGALAVASANAQATGFGPRAAFLASDWESGISGRFDLVLSNPPYVEAGAALPPDVGAHEPPAALFAGPDGLSAYRRLVPAISGLLAPGGVAILEAGVGQEGAIIALARTAGLRARVTADLAGRPRAISLTAGAGGLGKAPGGR
ncbi:peptide chain release factor N(5)-glutamine methyltransferase [Thermaurantiacus sp.]